MVPTTLSAIVQEPGPEGAPPGEPAPEPSGGNVAPSSGKAWASYSLRQRLELFQLLVRKELKIRYLGSLLGYLWVLFNPLVFCLVYYLAFKVIMRVSTPNYTAHLLSGMFPWAWFSGTISRATSCYQASSSLVKKTALQRYIPPLSMALNETMHFVLALPVLVGFLVVFGAQVRWQWIYQIPFLLVLQLALVFPLAVFFAVWTVFIRDLYHLTGVLLQLGFFLTPVIYQIEMVPEKLRPLLLLNPATALIQSWRGCLLQGRLPPESLGAAFLCIVVFSLMARWTYLKRSPFLGELL